jgi:hypothetical protein
VQKKNAQLFFVEPMECKEVRDISVLPRGNDWQYEVKFDGYRCIAIKQNNAVELFSRNGKPFGQFLNLFEPLRKQRARSFILDGEIVALSEDVWIRGIGRKAPGLDLSVVGSFLLGLGGHCRMANHTHRALQWTSFMTIPPSNKTLQRTRPERRGCNPHVPRAGLLSLGR